MLTHFVAVYVPSTRHGTPITPEEHREAVRIVAGHLAKEFGGFTATPAVGGWLSDTLGLIEEPVTIVKAYYDPATKHGGFPVVYATEIANRIKTAFDQEAVSVETEAGLIFV